MMTRSLRALALGAALVCIAPAVGCAATQFTPALENPAAQARTLDQKALAALESYAAVLEEATALVRDPRTPAAVKKALVATEAAATPGMQTLEIALAAYLRAQTRYQASASADASQVQKAATALAAATTELGVALQRAEAPVAELALLIRRK
jgi:hypothetical protein